MPATVDTLRIYLGIDPASTVDTQAMTMAVDGGNDLVQVLRPDLTVGTDGLPLPAWPARADQAALIEAARLYGRRGSVQGVAAFADLGVSLLPRLDPDFKSLLELGEYQPPVIA